MLRLLPPLWTALLVLATGCDAVSARMRAKEGVAAYRAGNIEQAAAKFAEAAQLAPNNPSIQINLGFANLSLFQAKGGDAGKESAKKAIAAFEHYLELVPGEERARGYLVQTFVDSGLYESAVEYFKPEIERPRPNGEALATLGNIAAKTGRFDEARKWYTRRIEAEPQNHDARLALGVLIWDHLHSHPGLVGEERIKLADDGIAVLKEAIRLKPAAPNPYTYTTMLYGERSLGAKSEEEKQKDLEKARQFFSQASQKAKPGQPAPKAPPPKKGQRH